MRFSDLLSGLGLGAEKDRRRRVSLWGSRGHERTTATDPWYESATAMKKYRRHRAQRNATARASRRRNRSEA